MPALVRAARLESLEILLDEPSGSICIDDSGDLLRSVDWFGSRQDPLYGRIVLGRCRLDDVDEVHLEKLRKFSSAAFRPAKRQSLGRDGQPRSALVPGRVTTPLARKAFLPRRQMYFALQDGRRPGDGIEQFAVGEVPVVCSANHEPPILAGELAK